MLRQQSASRSASARRSGTTTVELAVVLPVFGIFLAGIMEFGHAYMVVGALNGAAMQAARLGAVEGVSTSDVLSRADQVLSGALNTSVATVYVKDASVFDEQAVEPGEIVYATLPDIELLNADTRQLYVVRIELPYNDVALLPPFWAKGITLSGQSVMRHE